jgi:hypothetical protein
VACQSRAYDFVVGADLLYDPTYHQALLTSLQQLCAPHTQVTQASVCHLPSTCHSKLPELRQPWGIAPAGIKQSGSAAVTEQMPAHRLVATSAALHVLDC